MLLNETTTIYKTLIEIIVPEGNNKSKDQEEWT